MSPTVCIKAVRLPLFAAAARTGRSFPELATLVGVGPAAVADGTARVPHEVASRVWDQLAEACEEESFGIFAAELLDGAPVDFVDYALRHRETIEDLSRAFQRWQRIFHDANDAFMERAGDDVVFVHRFAGDPPTSRHLREFILAMWVMRLRRWTSTRIIPKQVSFRHAGPRDTERAMAFFGAVPGYRGAREELVFSADILHLSLAGASSSLKEMFEHQVEQEIERTQGAAAPIERIRAEIARRLATGTAELGSVARALALSRRTLQRRLGEHGTTYQVILDEERRKLALQRMGSLDATVTDIAFLLGFSDTSAFSRAFRRWTGSSPSEFRRA